MTPYHRLIVIAAVWIASGGATAEAQSQSRPILGQPQQSSSRLGFSTRWVFRAKSDVTVNSSVIRLGDVAEPVNRNLDGWSQLATAPIGLVPLSGQPMTIDRDRLSPIILGFQQNPSVIGAIDWVGDKQIQVAFSAAPAGSRSSVHSGSLTRVPTGAAIPLPAAYPIEQTNHQVTLDRPSSSQESTGEGQTRRQLRSSRPLSASEIRRITHLIELAVSRFLPQLAEEYLVKVSPSRVQLKPFRRMGGVTHCQLIGAATDGQCLLHVEARSPAGPIDAEVAIILQAHPKVVVPVHSLGRGHRIARHDLRMASIPAERLPEQAAIRFDDLIGKEPRSTLRSGQPIELDKVGAPILIHRGDLVEILVRGGGVTVATNGKAISSGARHQLIEVETANPKKRMIARVADVGITEIITRPPAVR